ncbi:hypothetical protein KEM52_002235, partial [Ascosphaera acerosa]
VVQLGIGFRTGFGWINPVRMRVEFDGQASALKPLAATFDFEGAYDGALRRLRVPCERSDLQHGSSNSSDSSDSGDSEDSGSDSDSDGTSVSRVAESKPTSTLSSAASGPSASRSDLGTAAAVTPDLAGGPAPGSDCSPQHLLSALAELMQTVHSFREDATMPSQCRSMQDALGNHARPIEQILAENPGSDASAWPATPLRDLIGCLRPLPADLVGCALAAGAETGLGASGESHAFRRRERERAGTAAEELTVYQSESAGRILEDLVRIQMSLADDNTTAPAVADLSTVCRRLTWDLQSLHRCVSGRHEQPSKRLKLSSSQPSDSSNMGTTLGNAAALTALGSVAFAGGFVTGGFTMLDRLARTP